MDFFIKLWDKLTRKPDEPIFKPFTDLQIKLLKDLQRHDGWRLYVELVDRYSVVLAEGLLTVQDTNKLIDMRGEIRGLRNAPLLVAQAINTEELNDEQRRTLTRATTRGDDGARGYISGPYAQSSRP